VDAVNEGSRTWVRQTTKSPFVDGIHETGKVLDGRNIEVTLRCRADTWVGVETLRAALLAAVEVSSWLLEVEVDGVSTTYRASGADSTSTYATQDFTYKERTVMLTIPVQPTPAVTGI
jgi:hypothetical protein